MILVRFEWKDFLLKWIIWLENFHFDHIYVDALANIHFLQICIDLKAVFISWILKETSTQMYTPL